jgi:exonuclease VII small subunit
VPALRHARRLILWAPLTESYMTQTTGLKIVQLNRLDLAAANEHLRTMVQALLAASDASQRAVSRTTGDDTLETTLRSWKSANVLVAQVAKQLESASEALIAIAVHLTKPQPANRADQRLD